MKKKNEVNFNKKNNNTHFGFVNDSSVSISSFHQRPCGLDLAPALLSEGEAAEVCKVAAAVAPAKDDHLVLVHDRGVAAAALGLGVVVASSAHGVPRVGGDLQVVHLVDALVVLPIAPEHPHAVVVHHCRVPVPRADRPRRVHRLPLQKGVRELAFGGFGVRHQGAGIFRPFSGDP